ncbi:signal transduction histidine kinase [Haloactinopolyspora alba]|uniref:histidine kinase n=1 Tax=Haloactinopolyspora alba TaxID=648780 RepID=A0A2P8DZ28_9ACTN|nr:signal transduction histidine kinase [Haloactinopolyspora alba]
MYAWVRRHPLLPDAALALAMYLMFGVSSAQTYNPGWAQAAIGGVFAAGLVFRRVAPVPSFMVVAAAAFVQWAGDVQLSPMDAMLLPSFYSISGYGPRWASRAGLGVGLLGAVLATARYVAPYGDQDTLAISVTFFAAMVVGAWALGDVRRVRQAHVAELVARAEMAERERDQQARIAAVEERARIARDMHDVVAHNLSVIVVQADGGRYVAEHDPATAVKTLGTIGETGRTALADMRRLLGVLRTGEPSEDRGPQPGIAQLPELLESVRQAGLSVEHERSGTPRELDAGRGLVVYRSVQEALTNTLKHAGPGARARVRLAYDADQVSVEVTDDGRGSAATSDGNGYGLRGMAERLGAFGGSVDAGPASGGGWRVLVRMPYGEGE